MGASRERERERSPYIFPIDVFLLSFLLVWLGRLILIYALNDIGLSLLLQQGIVQLYSQQAAKGTSLEITVRKQ